MERSLSDARSNKQGFGLAMDRVEIGDKLLQRDQAFLTPHHARFRRHG
jgi:hypothetical protein